MNFRTVKLGAVLWLAILGGCQVPDTASKNSYITPADANLVELLGPPPAPDSEAGKADMAAVVAAQAARTPADVEAARADSVISVFDFADVMGTGFSPERLPFASVFFHNLLNDGFDIVDAPKNHFARTRPFGQNPDLHPLFDIKPVRSYPSGHAAFAYIDGIILADMAPEKATAIFARAAAIAYHRVVAGVHFPTDIAAGRISAAVIDNALLHNARFMADYAKARLEIRGAIGLP